MQTPQPLTQDGRSPQTTTQGDRPHMATFNFNKALPLRTELDNQEPAEWEGFSPQALLLHWHYRLNHLPFSRVLQLAKKGQLPKKILKARIPRCHACLSGKATKRPWRTRAPPNGRSTPIARRAGDVISVDQLESTTPGRIVQLKGFLTKDRYRYATVFVDQYSKGFFCTPTKDTNRQ